MAWRADATQAPGLFAVLDRIGEGPNLEEYRYPQPWTVA
jgi:ureidoglycolate lyase